jgi:hypothetical protein
MIACVITSTLIINPAHADGETDEYINSFVKSLPRSSASLVSYENGRLTIKNTPWNPAFFIISCIAACGGGILMATEKNDGFFIGLITAAISGMLAYKNRDPGEYILTFDDYGLFLNGLLRATWSEIDNMAVDTVTLCNEYRVTSEEKKLKILDRFQNQLFLLSSARTLGVSFNNIVALIKHYQEKINPKQLVPSENKTTIQRQTPRPIYLTPYNYR